ncbi:hypothetical protein FRC01_000403 [Tulasnella sp. 417]|nr:hypothetical protein FRC01_000403 [Tulasnella sp. 417]
MESRNSTTSGETSAHQRFTPTNVFSIISRVKDAYAFKKRYLAGPEWDTVHIIPDEPYNKTHRFSHYVAFCKSKSILDSAFLRLRLQEVTVHKIVNKQTLKDVNPTLRRLHGSEIRSAIASSTTSSSSWSRVQGESIAPSPTAQLDTLGKRQTSAEKPHLGDRRPPSKTAGTTCSPTSPDPSTHISPSDTETRRKPGEDITATWRQDVPVSPDLALALAASSTANDVALPRTWSIKSRLPNVQDDDFVSASRAEALYLERKAKLEDLLNKPRAELDARMEEMREARKALERAKSDLDSKKEIEDFLNQCPDRPLVPEHWAYDTTQNTYVWKGPHVHEDGTESNLRAWKGFNF